MLEKARSGETHPTNRKNLERAPAHLEEARLGTIHSFRADLFSGRLVEAAIDPQFELLTQPQSLRLYREAFRSCFERRLKNLPEGTRRFLRRKTWKGSTESLISAAWELSKRLDFPTQWRRPGFDPIAR